MILYETKNLRNNKIDSDNATRKNLTTSHKTWNVLSMWIIKLDKLSYEMKTIERIHEWGIDYIIIPKGFKRIVEG